MSRRYRPDPAHWHRTSIERVSPDRKYRIHVATDRSRLLRSKQLKSKQLESKQLESKQLRAGSKGLASDADVAARISAFTGRVFSRLDGWARVALVLTGSLGVATWLAAMVAFRNSSWWNAAVAIVVLLGALVPAGAAWLLGRRARAIGRGVDSLETEIVSAMRNPNISEGLRSFLGDDDDDADDGRAGVARLAKGAMGIRGIIREHRASFGELAGAVRAMLLSPATLVIITIGLVILSLFFALFLLIAIF